MQLKMGVLDAATAPPSRLPSLYNRRTSSLRRCPLRSAATLLNAPSDSIEARLSTFCLAASSSLSNPYWS